MGAIIICYHKVLDLIKRAKFIYLDKASELILVHMRNWNLGNKVKVVINQTNNITTSVSYISSEIDGTFQMQLWTCNLEISFQ